jgi:hypothetical protein
VSDATATEYLHTPADQGQYASEYGHWIRMTTIAFDLKLGLSEAEALATEDGDKSASDEKIWEVLKRTEREMSVWEATLPEHLKFTEDGLGLQLSMFETSANSGAWCWCMFHTSYLAAVLMVDTVG